MRIRIILPGFLISCLLGNPVALAQQLLSLQDLDALVRRHIIADVSGKFHQRGWLAGIEEGQSIVMGEVSSETLNNVAVRNLFQASLKEKGVVRYDDASQDLLNDLINDLAQYGRSSILGDERNTAIYALNLEFDLHRYFFWNYYFADLEFLDIENSQGPRMIIDGWVATRITYVAVLILMSALSAFLFWQSYRLQAGWTLAMNARQSGRPLKGLATLEKLHGLHSGWPSVVKLKQQLQEQVNNANRAFNEALAAIRDGEIDVAREHLAKSLNYNGEHEQACDYSSQRLDDMRKAWSLMREADSLKQESPGHAIANYTRAGTLYPDLAPQLAARKAMVEVETFVQFNNEDLASNEKPSDEKPIDEKPIDEKPIDEKSIDEKSIDEKSIDEKSIMKS